MRFEVWNPDRHLPILGAWLASRDQAPHAGDARMYPPTGYLVDECAIGFLYATNAPLFGYLDGIVTDPAATARRRYRALNYLCVLLKDEAHALGIRTLIASTAIRGLLGICKRHGFTTYERGHEFIACALPP